MKACTKCGSTKRITEGRCGPCRAKSSAERYARMPAEEKAKRAAQRAAWYRANSMHHGEVNSRWRLANHQRTIFLSCRGRAKRAGIPFDLLLEDVAIPERCPVLGIELRRNAKTLGDASPTVDRMIPTLGYVRGNVMIISARANRIKSDASAEELRRVLQYVTQSARLCRKA